jgi:DNA-directed RNA polymerase specialized sigma24 family protein
VSQTVKLVMPKTEQEQILARLSMIAKLLAFQLVREEPTREGQVDLLDAAGFTPREIGDMLGIKAGTVTVTLYNIRRKKSQGKVTVAREARK